MEVARERHQPARVVGLRGRERLRQEIEHLVVEREVGAVHGGEEPLDALGRVGEGAEMALDDDVDAGGSRGIAGGTQQRRHGGEAAFGSARRAAPPRRAAAGAEGFGDAHFVHGGRGVDGRRAGHLGASEVRAVGQDRGARRPHRARRFAVHFERRGRIDVRRSCRRLDPVESIARRPAPRRRRAGGPSPRSSRSRAAAGSRDPREVFDAGLRTRAVRPSRSARSRRVRGSPCAASRVPIAPAMCGVRKTLGRS